MKLPSPHRCSRLIFGRANQPEAGLTLPELADPALVARKGELHLLCSQGLDPSALARLREHYYSDTSFDPIPSLRSAFLATYAESDQARHKLPAALIIQGLELFAVGTENAAIWLVGHNKSRELLLPRRTRQAARPPAGEHAEQTEPTLYSAQWRLSAGDILVITTHEAAQKLSARTIRRIVRGRRSPRAAARAAVRLVRASRNKSVPVSVIYAPGLRPVPALGATKDRPTPQPAHAGVRSEREPSPIWPALVLAAVAVAITLWIKRPTLSREKLSHLLIRMLTPAPTATAPSPLREPRAVASSVIPPTATLLPVRVPPANATTIQPRLTPTLASSPAKYSPPELLAPTEDETVHTTNLTLSWASPADLGDREYFDVRLWRIGAEKRSIAWTKDRHYIERLPSHGWHSWTVVVVRGQDGVIDLELTDEPKPINFRWHPAGAEVSQRKTSTPLPPTRITPGARPTRGTPDLADESSSAPSGD